MLSSRSAPLNTEILSSNIKTALPPPPAVLSAPQLHHQPGTLTNPFCTLASYGIHLSVLGRTWALPSPSSALLSLSAIIPKSASFPQLFHLLCFFPGCLGLKNKAPAVALEEVGDFGVQLEGVLAAPAAARTRARCEPCAWHQPGLPGQLPGPAHLQQEKHITAQACKPYSIILFQIALIYLTHSLEQTGHKEQLSCTGNDNYNIWRELSVQKRSKMLKKRIQHAAQKGSKPLQDTGQTGLLKLQAIFWFCKKKKTLIFGWVSKRVRIWSNTEVKSWGFVCSWESCKARDCRHFQPKLLILQPYCCRKNNMIFNPKPQIATFTDSTGYSVEYNLEKVECHSWWVCDLGKVDRQLICTTGNFLNYYFISWREKKV